MFYFFFESRNNKKDPVVIWLTGGPGCSSELALFYENGPFKIADNMTLVWNEYGWDQVTVSWLNIGYYTWEVDDFIVPLSVLFIVYIFSSNTFSFMD